MFGQLVVRAQIPLYISLKNQFSGPDRTSGFCFFVWLYFFAVALLATSVLLVALFWNTTAQVENAHAGLALFLILAFVCVLTLGGHLRFAFRRKYDIPDICGEGWGNFSILFDCLVGGFLCIPCSLAQMARHVFQYGCVFDCVAGAFAVRCEERVHPSVCV